MGYRTEYTLTVFDQGEELVGLIYEKLRREFPSIAEACNIEGQIVDSCKWYTHEEDMVQLSRAHPTVVFCLYCVGENRDDECRKYFRGGLMQICPATVSFDPFDPIKLREV